MSAHKISRELPHRNWCAGASAENVPRRPLHCPSPGGTAVEGEFGATATGQRGSGPSIEVRPEQPQCHAAETRACAWRQSAEHFFFQNPDDNSGHSSVTRGPSRAPPSARGMCSRGPLARPTGFTAVS